jgi:drug/metabolite transporter (DMT)-like permease
MDSSLEKLIELVTSSGSITEEHKLLIFEKAKGQGITEMEAQIYIDAALKKSQRYDPSTLIGDLYQSGKGKWMSAKDFKIDTWILIIASVLVFVAGFFPWIGSKVSSSFMGYSSGGSASVGGGVFYTIPASISAMAFAIRRDLFSKRLFAGLGIVFIAIALIVSYSSKVTSSYGGAYGSSSTSAGLGVYLMLVGGIIYTLGSLSSKFLRQGKIDSNLFLKILWVFIYFLAILFLTIPILVWADKYAERAEFETALIPLFGLGILFITSKVKLLSTINLPFKILYFSIIVDFVLKSLSFFPTSNVYEILNKKLGQLENSNATTEDIAPAVSDIANILSNSNQSWFVRPYLSDNLNTESGASIITIFNNLSYFIAEIIPYLILFIAFAIIIAFVKYILELINSDSLNKISIFLSESIRSKFNRSAYLSSQSIRVSIVRIGTILVGIFILLGLTSSFILNYSINNRVNREVNKIVNQYSEQLKIEQKNLAREIEERAESENLLRELVKNLTILDNRDLITNSDSVSPVLSTGMDSTWGIVVNISSSLDSLNVLSSYYNALGFKTQVHGPFSSDGGYNSSYYFSLCQFKNVTTAQSALEYTKYLFPNANIYNLTPTHSDAH